MNSIYKYTFPGTYFVLAAILLNVPNLAAADCSLEDAVSLAYKKMVQSTEYSNKTGKAEITSLESSVTKSSDATEVDEDGVTIRDIYFSMNVKTTLYPIKGILDKTSIVYGHQVGHVIITGIKGAACEFNQMGGASVVPVDRNGNAFESEK